MSLEPDYSILDPSTLDLGDPTPLGKLDAQQKQLIDVIERCFMFDDSHFPTLIEINSFGSNSTKFDEYYYSQNVNYNPQFRTALEYMGLGRHIPGNESKELATSNGSGKRALAPLLTRQQLDFLAEVLDPNDTRSIKQILKEMGLSLKTYNTWLKDKPFLEYYHQQSRIVVGNRIPEVKTALLKKAKTGDVNAIKLVLEITGEWSDKPEKEFNPIWFVTQILDILQRQVADPEILDNVAADLQVLLNKVGASGNSPVGAVTHAPQRTIAGELSE